MNKNFLILLMSLLSLSCYSQTLQQCYNAAESNYPLIKQANLIEQTKQLTLSNIKRGWIPQFQVSAQATYQSDVTAFPEQIQNLYQQIGINMAGLQKFQYRIGLDMQQTIYDGSAMHYQKQVAQRQAETDKAQLESNLYAIKQRVNDLYFGLLLINENIKLNEELQDLLLKNEQKLQKLYSRGLISKSDLEAVKAERLTTAQQTVTLQSNAEQLTAILSAFCGIEITDLQRPEPITSTTENDRPELKYFDAQANLINAYRKQLNAAITPRISLFASAFYGYPGYNLFNDMMHHDGSLNAIVGAKLSWNIGGFYTRKNDKNKLQLKAQMIENNREIFLFNNRLEQIGKDEQIKKYQRLEKDDADIIALRTSVRQASESKLENGTIDINDLLKDIFNENNAKIQNAIHQIEMLKYQYEKQWLNG